VKAHESDEGADVLDGHRLHTADLMIVLLLFLQKQNLMRSRDVDRGYVVKSRSHGVILEIETRLEATSEELVRDRCTSDGVQNENFRPRRCATVRQVYPRRTDIGNNWALEVLQQHLRAKSSQTKLLHFIAVDQSPHQRDSWIMPSSDEARSTDKSLPSRICAQASPCVCSLCAVNASLRKSISMPQSSASTSNKQPNKLCLFPPYSAHTPAQSPIPSSTLFNNTLCSW
jgi:hypothetical protein